jgi:uncharacterized membrane protein YbhN (UPF0104 family)
LQEEATLREQINKITKTNRILTLIVIVGVIMIILGAVILVYYLVIQMGVFTSFLDIIEGAPLFLVLTAIGGLIATIGYIPSFYLNLRKARLLEELKNLTMKSPACTR